MSETPAHVGPAGLAVAAKIHRLRRAHGISQTRLTQAVNDTGHPLSRVALSTIETGQRRVTVDDLVAIAAALGVTAAQLLEPAEACTACHGKPPAGFACLACGTEAGA